MMVSRLVVGCLLLAVFPGCTIIPCCSHDNVKAGQTARWFSFSQAQEGEAPSGAYLASTEVQWKVDWRCRNAWAEKSSSPIEKCPHNDPNLIAIAISGGGSRSAVFSAAVFFELARYNLLQQADVISSVSGGSFTAAYYVLSCDVVDDRECPLTIEKPKRFEWQREPVFKNMEKNFIIRWIGNWFWPNNIARYWLTYYDRTNIMAETLADNLFDNSWTGGEGFQFHDLNPQRPYLLINATTNTSTDENTHDLNFIFTQETFEKLDSDLTQYPIADAVMASSTFPGVFNYLTLKNYKAKDARYVHLFDGGTADNLGLTGVGDVIEKMEQADEGRQGPKLIILIDAYTPVWGKNAKDPDPRGLFDYIVDTNFLDTYDTLMDQLRKQEIQNFLLRFLYTNNDLLLHITSDCLKAGVDRSHYICADLESSAPKVYEVVSRIPTSFSIEKNDAICLQHAARVLVRDIVENKLHNEYWRSTIQMHQEDNEGYALERCESEQ